MDEIEIVPSGPFTINSTTKQIQLEVDPGKRFPLVNFLKFNGPASILWQLVKGTSNDIATLERTSAQILEWDLKVIATDDPNGDAPAVINLDGSLMVKSPGKFLLSVKFVQEAVDAFNEQQELRYQDRIKSPGAVNTDRLPDEEFIVNEPVLIDGQSTTLGVFSGVLDVVDEGLSDGLNFVAGTISSSTKYLMSGLGYLSNQLSGFIDFIEQSAKKIDPRIYEAFKKIKDKVTARIKENQKKSWIEGIIGIKPSDVPLVGDGIAFLEETIIAISTLGTEVAGAVTQVAKEYITNAWNDIDNYFGLSATAKQLASNILGIPVDTLEKIFTGIKEVQKIQELFLRGNITEGVAEIKKFLTENNIVTEKDIDKTVAGIVSYLQGNLLNLIFGTNYGNIIRKNFKMTSDTVGVLTITNPKELQNNLQITSIVLSNSNLEIEKIVVTSGGNIINITGTGDITVPIVISPGQTAEIRITFKNPEKKDPVKITAEYNYLGLPKSIDKKTKLPVGMIEEGETPSDEIEHIAPIASSTKTPQPEDVLEKIKEEYAKAADAYVTAKKQGSDAAAQAQAELEKARKKLNDALAKLEEAKKMFDDIQKKSFYDLLGKVNFESLPPELQELILTQGAKIGVNVNDVENYIKNAVNKVKKVKDLLGNTNKLWQNLTDAMKGSLAQRLVKGSEAAIKLLNNTIDIHNQVDIILGGEGSIETVDPDIMGQLDKLRDIYKDKLFQMIKDGTIKEWDKLDPKIKEAIGIGIGLFPDPNIKDPKKQYDEWMNRVKQFFLGAKKIKELEQKKEAIKNEIIRRVNEARKNAENAANNGTQNNPAVPDANKTKNEPKKIEKKPRQKDKKGDKKQVTKIPVPEITYYQDLYHPFYNELGITPETIQDIYDNAEDIIRDPIIEIKDAMEDGTFDGITGFTQQGAGIGRGSAGSGGAQINVGGTGEPTGVTGFNTFEEGDERDWGTYIIYSDKDQLKFSVDENDPDAPFIYAIYKYIRCSNDTPETSKLRAKANILKIKDDLNKKYYYQGTDEYIGDDACPDGEIQIQLVPSLDENGNIDLRRVPSEKRLKTGIVEAENTYMDEYGNIIPVPHGITGQLLPYQRYQWRDKDGIQQPEDFVYPEDRTNVVQLFDPSQFQTTDPQNDTQKSVREKIIKLLQTGGIVASKISFDILLDGSVIWDGEVKINKNGLTADGKIPINFAIVNGKFDCSGLGLITLENSPRMVYGEYNCSNNNLTTLKHAPIASVAFVADNNPLGDGTGLKYGPQLVIGWPTDTIIHGQKGYIYSCENCKLSNLKDNNLKTFGQGGINFKKNKLNSLEEMQDALSEGVYSIDISYNEFESLDTIPSIEPILAFSDSWADSQTKAYYKAPKVRYPSYVLAIPAKNQLQSNTLSTINNFVIYDYTKTQKKQKPNSGAAADMKITNLVDIKGETKFKPILPASDKDSSQPQKPRATVDEIRNAVKKANGSEPLFPYIVAVRGYFKGLPQKRNLYRDAIFLVESENKMHPYNANTLPTFYGKYKDSTLSKFGITYPVLQPGIYVYKLGKHTGNRINVPALVQPSIQNARGESVIDKIVTFIWKSLVANKDFNSSNAYTEAFSKLTPKLKSGDLNLFNIFGSGFARVASLDYWKSQQSGPNWRDHEFNIPVYVGPGGPASAIGLHVIDELRQLTQYPLPSNPFLYKRDDSNELIADLYGAVRTNLHPGGYVETWSNGCQTIPHQLYPNSGTRRYDQWTEFYKKAKDLIKRRNVVAGYDSKDELYDAINYVLITNPFVSEVSTNTPQSRQSFSQDVNEVELIKKYPETSRVIMNYPFLKPIP